MEHKHYSLKTSRYVIVALIFAVLVEIGVVVLLANRDRTDAPKPAQAQTQAASADSLFTFKASEASGWRKGPSNKTSLALFSDDHACFVSVEYRTGVANEASVTQIPADLTKSGYQVTTGEVLDLTQQTTAGSQQYKLHQYAVAGTGDVGQLYGGQGFGNVQLANGYIKVQERCNTAEQLPAATPALQAITFRAEK